LAVARPFLAATHYVSDEYRPSNGIEESIVQHIRAFKSAKGNYHPVMAQMVQLTGAERWVGARGHQPLLFPHQSLQICFFDLKITLKHSQWNV